MIKLKRAGLMLFPVLVFIISAVVLLTTTFLKQGIYYLFKKENYWTIGNEWDQVLAEAGEWAHYWRTGRSR